MQTNVKTLLLCYFSTCINFIIHSYYDIYLSFPSVSDPFICQNSSREACRINRAGGRAYNAKGEKRKRPCISRALIFALFLFSRVHSLICRSFFNGRRGCPAKRNNRVKNGNIPNDYCSQYDRTIWSLSLNRSSNRSLLPRLAPPVFLPPSFLHRQSTFTHQIPVSCSVANGIHLVFSSLGRRKFLCYPSSSSASFSFSPPAGVCRLPPVEVSSGRT